ncbi:MAG: hypothetical protein A7315_12995 [Candidatus Altiarchaeales archaeon WOR_SM1_79]|nr:MAG: hypothetical protein A7315_12995 [Candidatus Altiarchaeales archaeon WOR_SM1_79]
MANAHITVDEFKELLKRVEKLEYREVEVPTDIGKDVDELKERYYGIDKRTEVTDTKIDSLRTEMHVEINSLRTEMHSEINSLRTELRITLGAILAVLITIGIKLIFYS